MALQKNLFMLIALGIIIIYSAVKKEQLRRPILITLLIPLALTSGYILYLYHSHALKDYFELNWLIYFYRSLDYKMFSFYSCILPAIGILCVFLPNKNKNSYLNTIKILYITECINLLFSASSSQYLLTLYPFLAIIFAALLSQHKEKYQLSILAILFFVNIYTFYNIYNYPFVRVKRFVYLSEITLSSTDKKDLIIPDMLWTGGLRKSALGYYWFGLEGIARIDYSVFHRHAFPDIKLIILNRKPKIITNTAIRNCLNEKNQITLDCTIDQTIPEEILDNYLKSELMFLRKD